MSQESIINKNNVFLQVRRSEASFFLWTLEEFIWQILNFHMCILDILQTKTGEEKKKQTRKGTKMYYGTMYSRVSFLIYDLTTGVSVSQHCDWHLCLVVRYGDWIIRLLVLWFVGLFWSLRGNRMSVISLLMIRKSIVSNHHHCNNTWWKTKNFGKLRLLFCCLLGVKVCDLRLYASGT